MKDPGTCTVCAGALDADARFCSACGSPTPTGEHTSPSLPDAAPGEFEARLRSAVGEEYDILEVAGEGGFARVFKARDIRLNRLVAIKVIRPDYVGARVFLDRFRREGVALAKLRHPGIVPIYDIRERDQLIYYVMPFIEGKTLRQRLDQSHTVPPHEAHRIFNQLSDAIAAAHRVGIVHRDIKPDNVILEGNLGNVLLMDFGIAKAEMEDGDRLTASGVLVGTPRYMSPEQASGAEVDARSDIYSLGVLAYEMVSGRLPIDGETTQELIARHLTEIPEPVRRINPSIPRGLAEVIMRCLAKEPAERFADAGELSARLLGVRIFEPRVEEAATGSRGPGLRVLAAMFALGITAGVAAALTLPRFAPPPPVPPESAPAYVASWLNLTGSPAMEDSLVTAFARDADIRIVTMDPIHGATATSLRRTRLASRDDLMALLQIVQPDRLHVRDVGDVTVLSAAVGGAEDERCGTLQITVRAEGAQWRIEQLHAVDFGLFCPPADSGRVGG